MDFFPEKYGAAGDGRVKDTDAIQQALTLCARQGGRVVFSSGKTYLSASLRIGSDTELYFENGSRLLASGELDDYFRPDQPERPDGTSDVGTPVVGKPSYVFLYARGAKNVRMTGYGTIDANGSAFTYRYSPYYITGSFYPRPTVIYMEDCRRLTFRDVTLCNAPFWTLHLAGCYDALITQLRILNPLDVANSDGIDIDHSQQIRLTDCHIECADDCICMKNTLGNREYPGTRDVIVDGCTLVSTSAALKIGTEGVDDFENLLFSRCIISRSNRGISVQIRDQGNVRNVSFSDIVIETRRFAENWWGCAEPIAITSHRRIRPRPAA